MEYIILSLLLLKGMTIYEMRTYIQQNLSTVCSDLTYGQLLWILLNILHNIPKFNYYKNSFFKYIDIYWI